MTNNEQEKNEAVVEQTKDDEFEVEIVEDLSPEVKEALDETQEDDVTAAASIEEVLDSFDTQNDEGDLGGNEEEKSEPTEPTEGSEETTEVIDEDEKSFDQDLETVITEALEQEEDLVSKHLTSIGLKSLNDLDEDHFLCQIERKMLKGEVCSFCRGGCAREGEEKELLGLLDVEIKATEEFGAVIGSGYSPQHRMFVLDVERKDDGVVVEVAYDDYGKLLGWHMLDQDMISQKDALAGQTVINMDEAAEVAVKELGGTAMSVEGAIFEGHDSYVIEVDAEGKSYDAYVALDGTLLGYDTYFEDGDLAEKTAEELVEEKTGEKPDRLAQNVAAINNVETLKAVMDAIGDDIDSVPSNIRNAIVKVAMELEAEELIPKAWVVPEGQEPPSPPASTDETKKKTVVVEGEPDEDFQADLDFFETMIKETKE